MKKAKPFIIDGETYLFLKDAAKDLDVNYLTIRYRILSENKKYESYSYIDDKTVIESIINEFLEKL